MTLNKEDIREDIKRQLESLPAGERARKSELIRRQLMDLEDFKRSRCLLIYRAMAREVDTREIIVSCLKTGKRIVAPKVISRLGALEIREVKSLDDFGEGVLGIAEPLPGRTREVDLSEIDCAVIPGLAFDREGRRLGRGGGYFDRFLKQLPPDVPRIALAFDFQVIDRVPCEGHDQPVDRVLVS